MDNMNNVAINNNASVNLADIKEFKNQAKDNRLEAGARAYSLKDKENMHNDANMALKRKMEWSAITEKADQIQVRKARMDLADLEAKVAADEAARTPQFTEGQMKEVKTSSASKGFWFGALLTAVVGGYIAYRKIKSKKEEIEYLEKKIEEMKK